MSSSLNTFAKIASAILDDSFLKYGITGIYIFLKHYSNFALIHVPVKKKLNNQRKYLVEFTGNYMSYRR